MNNEWMKDARKIPDETMSYIRKMAIKAIRELSYSPELVAKIFDISRSCIYEWLKKFDNEGYDALDTHKAPGMSPIITPTMDDWLKATIVSSTPEKYDYDTQLWTCEIITNVLNEEFDIDVQPSAVYQHLKKLGFSYQKPNYRFTEQNCNEVDKFIQNKFPKIQAIAEKIDADIYFEDESKIDLNQHSGKTWGIIGQTPNVSVTGKRGSYNVLSAVNNEGKSRFSVKEGTINSDVFIGFLKQLLRGRNKPIILIIDNSPIHKSKKVRDFVRSHRKQIRIYFLPKYSPELNPTEQFWNEVKNNRIGRKSIKNKLDLKEKIYSALRSLQKTGDRIKSFFGLPETQYAGA
jgi:transposase